MNKHGPCLLSRQIIFNENLKKHTPSIHFHECHQILFSAFDTHSTKSYVLYSVFQMIRHKLACFTVVNTFQFLEQHNLFIIEFKAEYFASAAHHRHDHITIQRNQLVSSNYVNVHILEGAKTITSVCIHIEMIHFVNK